MISGNTDLFEAPIRSITAKVELSTGNPTPIAVSGNPISINDVKPNTPIDIQLESDTITDFTGIEVKRTGKNIVNTVNPKVYHNNAVRQYYDYTLSDTGFRATAVEAISSAWAKLSYLIGTPQELKGKTITATGKYKSQIQKDNHKPWMSIQMTDIEPCVDNENIIYNNGGYIGGSNSCFNLSQWKESEQKVSYTVTGEEERKYITLSCNISYGGALDIGEWTEWSDIQVEIGDTPTEFEPYQGTVSTADASGKVEGIYSKSGLNYLYTISDVNMNVSYQQYGEKFIFTHDGDLQSITVDRAGANKFFGFGICQKANIKIRDVERKYKVNTSSLFDIYFDNKLVLPRFTTTETHRDENTNALSITAYDAIYQADNHTVSEVGLESYTISEFARRCGSLLGVGVVYPSINEFALEYPEGGNYSGTETIREALNHIAEATQTFYFINSNNLLEFRRLDRYGDPVLTIGKDKYFTLEASEPKVLTAICSATDLGDNLISGEGLTQYVWNNPLWDNREDRATLVENALTAMKDTTIIPYKCKWRGNYLLEPGDKIGIVGKDDSTIQTYLINDKLTYNGGMKQESDWEYQTEEKQHSNPTSLGEMLKLTQAKVDKANQTISLIVSDTNTNTANIAELTLATSGITATVEGIQTTTDNLAEGIATLSSQVSMAMTDEQVAIKIQSELSNGVDKVKTKEKNYTFDDTGLSISSSENNITTTITEDGMTIKKNEDDVLVANNEGVQAIDLHATTYLIIGKNSRFEDMGARSACFWIGG